MIDSSKLVNTCRDSSLPDVVVVLNAIQRTEFEKGRSGAVLGGMFCGVAAARGASFGEG
jgi:hypothetical protein